MHPQILRGRILGVIGLAGELHDHIAPLQHVLARWVEAELLHCLDDKLLHRPDRRALGPAKTNARLPTRRLSLGFFLRLFQQDRASRMEGRPVLVVPVPQQDLLEMATLRQFQHRDEPRHDLCRRHRPREHPIEQRVRVAGHRWGLLCEGGRRHDSPIPGENAGSVAPNRELPAVGDGPVLAERFRACDLPTSAAQCLRERIGIQRCNRCH
mmetsp:Transcript_113062/g.324960  ORF Transcript_113062/g.324960 Transcript_113062/m.324960 type:complete len:211 (+) Transcript_113062:1099-1731(+)